MAIEYRVVFVVFTVSYALFAFLWPTLAHAQAPSNILINFGSSSPANSQFYTPPYLEVAKGTSVTWTNNDVVTHSITLVDPQLKDTVVLPPTDVVTPNSKITYIFKNSGVYDYYCVFYPFMTGRIVVN